CLTMTAQRSAAEGTGGMVEATIVTAGADGTKALVPGAAISISGPGGSQQAVADQQAVCHFSGLAPGEYRIEATAPGMSGSLVVNVSASVVTNVSVALQPAALKESVTVTADADLAPLAEPSGQISLGKSTIVNAPNKDDRIDSVLPMIPGVVRGLDGT